MLKKKDNQSINLKTINLSAYLLKFHDVSIYPYEI